MNPKIAMMLIVRNPMSYRPIVSRIYPTIVGVMEDPMKLAMLKTPKTAPECSLLADSDTRAKTGGT